MINFVGFQIIYTDGSKSEAAVAAAAMSGTKRIVKRLPKNASIYSAEAHGVLLALSFLKFSAFDRFFISTVSCLPSKYR